MRKILDQCRFTTIAPGVARLTTVFVNLYSVDLADGSWVLIDTGLPGFAGYVRRAVESYYGPSARPAAIVLTHGHFDHAGSAHDLAEAWDVPIYAHKLELPFLTGRSDYPPQDPTPGGAISFLSRFFPHRGIDLGNRVHPLPGDGTVAPLPGWRWLHTPGHTSGHTSFFREANRVLLAGDAFATTDLDSWASQVTWPRKVCRPPTPFTPDWASARQSIQTLAELRPRTLAAGHGFPLEGKDLGETLSRFAKRMAEPPAGRYSSEPARYSSDGSVAAVPPPAADSLPRNLALGTGAVILAIGAASFFRADRRLRESKNRMRLPKHHVQTCSGRNFGMGNIARR